MSSRVIRLTDDRGRALTKDEAEPNPGSVVLTQGVHGTAWQRFFSDGMWHSTRGGKRKAWWQLLDERNLVLVYDADVRRMAGETPPATYAETALRKEGA